jgi:hypothetical protein
MSDLALRPRSATELVDAAFQLYRREPLQFIIALGVIYIPWMVLVGALGLTDPNTPVTPANSVIRILGGVLVYTLSAGVSTVLANDPYFDRSLDLGRSFRKVLASFVPLALVMFVAGFVTIVGFMFLVVPGFYFLAHFFAVKQAVLLEGAGTAGALGRSAGLSKGYKKHILVTLFILYGLYIAIWAGVSMFTRVIPSLLVQTTISTIVTTIVYPLFGITETLLYYDIRIRKEGFDIEYLASGALEKDTVAT